jgi:GT2 family glycosyltransferase
MRIGFVCTNYNNAALTRAFVASLFASPERDDLRVVVVDNASAPDDVAGIEALGAEYPRLDVVINDRNLGYFPGLNVGICHLRTRFPDVQHMVVGNNDLVFPEDFAERVRRHRDVFDRWAVVAPDLVTPEGVHQNPHVHDPISRTRRLVWDVYHSSYAAAALIRKGVGLAGHLVSRRENRPDSRLHEQAAPVEQGYGACYLLGPAFFREFNRLYAPTFLMQEEYFLYEQLKTIGQLTYYDPRFVVQHRGHATMGRVPGRALWAIARESHLEYKRFARLSQSERQARIEASCRTPDRADCLPLDRSRARPA